MVDSVQRSKALIVMMRADQLEFLTKSNLINIGLQPSLFQLLAFSDGPDRGLDLLFVASIYDGRVLHDLLSVRVVVRALWAVVVAAA